MTNKVLRNKYGFLLAEKKGPIQPGHQYFDSLSLVDLSPPASPNQE